MNVWADENKALVTAELPGVSPDKIDISVQDDTLTLRGTREPEELEEGMNYHRRERRFGSFTRTLRLPFQVSGDGVDAAFSRGVLSVSLPRAEADKPRKITVRSA
jgi:HSP20 family protein